MIFEFFKNSFKSVDINKSIDIFLNDNNGVLVDVRSASEYKNGHIKNSINIPVESISSANLDKNKNIYLYCASGTRSGLAVSYLKSKGYNNVFNIGGISDYNGKIEM